MNSKHYFTKQELISKLDNCINKTLGQVDKNNVFQMAINNDKVTGIAGLVIEESVLEYEANSNSEPDIIVDNTEVEVKTTGIKNAGDEYVAKEPMSITSVSPNIIVNEKFENSRFWHKLNHMLLIYYLYNSKKVVKAIEYKNFLIKGYEFHEFSDTDRKILENDWNIVKKFIKYLQDNYVDYENQYSRISSELREKLLYIDTAPKWPNRPRFRLKRTVVSAIVKEYFGDKKEKLPGEFISYDSIYHKCHEVSEKYNGMTIKEIANTYNIETSKINKSITEKIAINIFDSKAKKISKIDLFNKIGLLTKTITVTESGSRTEDMKLFPIDFNEFYSDVKFEESQFYEYFYNTQMICLIFQEQNKGTKLQDNVFIGTKKFIYSNDFIENEVKACWYKIKNLINNNKLQDVISYDKNRKPIINNTGVIKSAPNFPKSKDGIIFVRGSGSDSNSKIENVNGVKMYKQYIWIKGKYITNQLLKNDFI